ncbi:hypothetical protein ABEF95_006223 [Exophiala dermatitidis]
MSFLYQTTPILRTAVRATALQQSTRLFSTAIVHQKSATEAVKDGLKKVDRVVSDAAVTGIDKTIELKDKAAEVAGVETGKAQGKASEVAGEAKGKAAELSGEAKGKAAEVKGKLS